MLLVTSEIRSGGGAGSIAAPPQQPPPPAAVGRSPVDGPMAQDDLDLIDLRYRDRRAHMDLEEVFAQGLMDST